MFTRFHVGKVESNLFDSAQFKSWATSVSNIYKSTEKGNAAMVVTLTNRYGDETLASMLTAAKEIPDTKDVASSMLKAQIDSWVVQKTPADEVFKILKLDKAGYKLFASPSWTRWMTYAENRGNTNPYELLLSILIKRFSDDKIATMLARSKTELDTKIASDALENALHQKWMSVGKSEDDVFKLLKLHQEGTTKLLKNPVLSTWISYVSKKEMLDPYEELLFKLAKQYDDETLLEFIFASKEVTSTSTIAKNLEDALPKYWLGKRKTADDVFTLLKLKNVDKEKLFDSPTWKTWISYLTAKSTQYKVEKNPDGMMYVVLKEHYGTKDVETMITKAKKSKSTEAIATKLQEEVWRSEKLSANDVFHLLKLSYEGDDFLTSPALSTWISYATKLGKFDKGYSRDRMAITELEKHIPYEDLARKIDNVMDQALIDKNTVVVNTVGILQKEQFLQWLYKRWEPDVLEWNLSKRNPNPVRDRKVALTYLDFFDANKALREQILNELRLKDRLAQRLG
ncbi:RxLR effector protein [Phytophthora megakarya]|uniref:RxLR effector protein n=1 Tax=Phytophthora megakarya TaxID=4795 RepID=A0A225VE68_9STRA|nr:RxLR effector protein [Phytophthora megakarya]